MSTVVFNAGINRRCVTALSEPEVWLRVVETNLISAANLTRLALPYLIRHSLFTRAAAQTAGEWSLAPSFPWSARWCASCVCLLLFFSLLACAPSRVLLLGFLL